MALGLRLEAASCIILEESGTRPRKAYQRRALSVQLAVLSDTTRRGILLNTQKGRYLRSRAENSLQQQRTIDVLAVSRRATNVSSSATGRQHHGAPKRTTGTDLALFL